MRGIIVKFTPLLRIVIMLIPKRYRLPLRYIYARLSGTLEDELVVLERLIYNNRVAIDIGASVGLWSYRLSKLFNKVEAFEPIPQCVKELKAYGKKNITVHNVGLSSAQGKLELHILRGSSHGCGTFGNISEEHETISVTVRTLDDYAFTNVSFIKIDVEGHELDVLKGAEATIIREKPVMVVEIEQRHLTYDRNIVFQKIIDFGYEAYYLEHGELRPYAELSEQAHQELPGKDPLPESYVRNFIFKPRLV